MATFQNALDTLKTQLTTYVAASQSVIAAQANGEIVTDAMRASVLAMAGSIADATSNLPIAAPAAAPTPTPAPAAPPTSNPDPTPAFSQPVAQLDVNPTVAGA